MRAMLLHCGDNPLLSLTSLEKQLDLITLRGEQLLLSFHGGCKGQGRM